ncbi:MAG: hypothetical protein OER88_13555, partial [Planctomycetota bacterium]|nr:hypothetical protein [Planctomycetota bacterium]
TTMLVRDKPWPHIVSLRDTRSGAFVGRQPGFRVEPGGVIRGIPPGSYRAVLHAEQRAQLHTFPHECDVEVEAGKETTMPVKAKLAARLALLFVMPGRKNWERISVQEVRVVRDGGDRVLNRWRNGRPFMNRRRGFSMDLLVSGHHRIRIAIRGRPPITRDVHLAPGRMTVVRVLLDD